MAKDRRDVPGDLTRRAVEGDRWAYGRLFRAFYGDIYDYVTRRVGNRSDAEDLTMKVFAKGLEAISGFEQRGCSTKAWFYRIAHNAVVDHYRQQKKDLDLNELPDLEDLEKDIVGDLVDRETLRDLYVEVRSLPTAQAEVMILRFMEDLSVAETGMVLGKKESTVRALQFKGIRNLRARFREREEDDDERGGKLETG